MKELHFSGAPSEAFIGGKRYINTVYGFELDGIKIAFLGKVGDEKGLSTEAKEMASNADMVFVPLDGDPAGAYKTALALDPNVIIPYDYTKEALARFLKEGGQDKNEVQDKATLKRRDLDGKEGHIIVLAPQS